MKKGSYRVVDGDATKPNSVGTTPIVIPHVCNDIGAWGAGFVKAISKKFGFAPEQSYRAWHERSQKKYSYYSQYPANTKIEMSQNVFDLGATQLVHVGNRIVIANMIAQHNVMGNQAPDDHMPPIRYGALIKCMHYILYEYKKAQNYDEVPFEIHCPQFGSNLAGGNWKEIEKMIHEIWVDNGLHVTSYQFDTFKL